MKAPPRAAPLLAAVMERSAALCARWMAAGFVHGVLNSDNMNINGESFDYGPYRFLPRNDPGFTAAYFDQTGLYAFGRQPEAVLWNLSQLGGCLTLVAEQEPLEAALSGFAPAYKAALAEGMVRRLGLELRAPDEDAALAGAAFRALAEGGEPLRWEPFFFDWFGGSASAARATAGPRAAIYEGAAFLELRERMNAYVPARPEALDADYFRAPEPEELLYDEIEAIWADIAERDDWTAFNAKIARIGRAREAYGLEPPAF